MRESRFAGAKVLQKSIRAKLFEKKYSILCIFRAYEAFITSIFSIFVALKAIRMTTSHGIILHSLRYGDAQIIVTIFTEEAGTIPFIVRQPRNGRRGVRASAWQPLSLVEVVWEPRPNVRLQKPKELTLWQPWRSLAFEPAKTAMSLFMGEFLSYALRGEQENKALFDFLRNGLTWFDESEVHYANFHIVFLLHLTRFLGFFPNVDEWHEGSFFDLQAASFTDSQPLHRHYLNPEESALVPKFLRMNIRSMQAVGLNGVLRRRALEIVTEFYRLHIPEFPELKSLDVLTEIFR